MSVYFVQRADGLIKVGFSDDFGNRFERLSKSHPGLKLLRVIAGDQRREHSIHHTLRANHEFGEWFRPDPEVLAFIETVEDGDAVDCEISELKAGWIAYEVEHAAQCVEKAREFYALCYGRRGETFMEVSQYIESAYGIQARTFQRLFQGQILVPSSALTERVRQAHVCECELLLEHLKQEVARLVEEDALSGEEITVPEQIENLRARIGALRADPRTH